MRKFQAIALAILIASISLSGTSASAATTPTKSWEKVYFAPDSTELTKAAKIELRQIAREYAGASTIVVTGYVQKGGSTWNNYTLAKKRAKAVTKYLKARGMTAKLTTKSGGVPKTGGTSTKARRATLAITMPAAVVEPPKDDDAPLCPTDNSTAMKLTVEITEKNIADMNNVVNLPLSGISSVEVNWGDGTSDTLVIHTYASTGTFNITITGSMTGFGAYNWAGIKLLTRVESFGALGITSLDSAFEGATNLVSVPTTLPSSVTDMTDMFVGATAFNHPNISCWDTSAVTNMGYMFVGATAFNQPLGSWDTSKVTDMYAMFEDATAFNQPLGSWNTAAVTDMVNMFSGANAWSSTNVDSTLNGWAAKPQQQGIRVHATACRTVDSEAAVARLLAVTTADPATTGRGWTAVNINICVTPS